MTCPLYTNATTTRNLLQKGVKIKHQGQEVGHTIDFPL